MSGYTELIKTYYEENRINPIPWSELSLTQRDYWIALYLQASVAEKLTEKTVDMVNEPPHYNSGPKCPGCNRTIQCIDIVRWLPFNPGNSIKYLWRRYFGGKAGEDAIEPVRKAHWYLQDEIRRLEQEPT